MMKPKQTVAKFVAEKIKASGKTHLQIATELGYPAERATMIDLMSQGKMKLPINKVCALAGAVGEDPARMLKLVLQEYSPDTVAAIEQATKRDLASGRQLE